MKYLLIFSLSLIFSCSKNQTSMHTRPLKAVPTATVNGKVITLTADKSEGDVCSVGWAMSEPSPAGATVVFDPISYIQGEKHPKRNESGQPYFITGTFKYSAIKATVNKIGTYKFSLQVLDAFKNENWADITVEVK